MTCKSRYSVSPSGMKITQMSEGCNYAETKRGRGWQRNPFSSLFIGKDFSTGAAQPRPTAPRFPFQFPLHREGLFNRSIVPGSHDWTTSFSSLFIGKDFSTRPERTLACRADHFQFPLHREGLFNPYTVRHNTIYGVLSVPSS